MKGYNWYHYHKLLDAGYTDEQLIEQGIIKIRRRWIWPKIHSICYPIALTAGMFFGVILAEVTSAC